MLAGSPEHPSSTPNEGVRAEWNYVGMVARHWKLVAASLVMTALLVAGATAVLANQAPRFQAEATLLLTNPRYTLEFDPKFVTQYPDFNQYGARMRDAAEEYRAVAMGSEVRRMVEERTRDTLPRSELDTAAINVRVRGLLLTISATTKSAFTSALLADAYARAAADRLNAVYGASAQERSMLEGALADAVARHQEAQSRWVAFTRENRIDELTLEINQKRAIRQALAEKESVINKARLAAAYSALAEVDQLSRDARALRQQVEGTSLSPQAALASSLSLMRLHTRLTNLGSVDLSLNLGPSPQAGARALYSESSVDSGRRVMHRVMDVENESPPSSTAVSSTTQTSVLPSQLLLSSEALGLSEADIQRQLLTDVDSVLLGVDLRRAEFEQAIDNLSRQVAQVSGETMLFRAGDSTDAPRDRTVAQLTAEINELRSQLSAESYQREILSQSLERVKTTRSSLETKLQETEVAGRAAGAAATIISEASTPAAPAFPPPLSRTLPWAAFLGLLVGASLALVVEVVQLRRSRPPGVASSGTVAPAGR